MSISLKVLLSLSPTYIRAKCLISDIMSLLSTSSIGSLLLLHLISGYLLPKISTFVNVDLFRTKTA